VQRVIIESSALRTAILCIAVLAAWIAFDWLPGASSRTPPRSSEVGALYHDEGMILYVVAQAARGLRAHEEVFWNYGLLPLATLVQSAKLLGGVSLENFEKHQQAGYLIRSLLMLVLISRIVGLKQGILYWFMLGMGWSSGGRPATPHESIVLLLLALAWQPPAGRSRANLAMIGLLFGLLQWIKFGTAFFAGAAWLIVDLMWQVSGQKTCAWPAWLKQMAWVFLFFVIVEGGRWLHAFVTLPPEHAALSIVPLYFLSWYASYTGDFSSRWPTFTGWSFFWGTQFPALVGLAGVFVIPLLILFRSKSVPARFCHTHHSVFGAIFLGIFYVLGVAGFFQHVWNMYLYRWLLLPCVAVLFGMVRVPWRIVLVFLLIPSALVIPLNAYRSLVGGSPGGPAGLLEFSFPNGQSLWLSEKEGTAALRVVDWAKSLKVEAARRGGPPPKFVMLPSAAGLAFYAGLDLPTRHAWLFPGSVREFEQGAASEQFLASDGVIMKFFTEDGEALSPREVEETRNHLLQGIFPVDSMRSRLIEACGPMTHLGNGWFVGKIRPSS
jgi:hypothetical protein